MNHYKIKDLAINLEKVGNIYINDADVEKLMSSLKKLLDRAKNLNIKSPVEFVPGDYFFTEKNCSSYPDLESAYSKFKLQITMEEKEYEELISWAERQKKDLFNK